MKSYKQILNEIRVIAGLEVKLEQVSTSEGTVFEADSFEAGQPVFIVTDEGNIAVPAGDYELEDGRTIVVGEDGVIAEVKEAGEAEAEPAAEPEAEAEEMAATPDYVTREELNAVLEDLKGLFSSMKPAEETAKVEEEPKVEMSAEPAAKPIKANPERKAEVETKSNFSAQKANSIEARVFKFINN